MGRYVFFLGGAGWFWFGIFGWDFLGGGFWLAFFLGVSHMFWDFSWYLLVFVCFKGLLPERNVLGKICLGIFPIIGSSSFQYYRI